MVRLLRPYDEPTCGTVPGSHRLRSNGLIHHRSGGTEATLSPSARANPRARGNCQRCAEGLGQHPPCEGKAARIPIQVPSALIRVSRLAPDRPRERGRRGIAALTARIGYVRADRLLQRIRSGSNQSAADRGIKPVHRAVIRPPMENGGRRLCNSHRPCASKLPYRIFLLDQPFRL